MPLICKDNYKEIMIKHIKFVLLTASIIHINIQITIIIVQLIIAVKMLKINIELTYSI